MAGCGERYDCCRCGGESRYAVVQHRDLAESGTPIRTAWPVDHPCDGGPVQLVFKFQFFGFVLFVVECEFPVECFQLVLVLVLVLIVVLVFQRIFEFVVE